MAAEPVISLEEFRSVFECEDARYITTGGQKSVFCVKLLDQIFAAKVIYVCPQGDEGEDRSIHTFERAQREVDTMERCGFEHFVRAAPFGLSIPRVNGKTYLVFLEEWIDGETLDGRLGHKPPLSQAEVVTLGRQIGIAINRLWQHKLIHRDIKPGNIMRRAVDGSFVLLDAGLAFDLEAHSLSTGPVGTKVYFSPEQFDFHHRRTALDFRSDLFSLGVTMYQLATGVHPFWTWGDTIDDVQRKILTVAPLSPSTLNSALTQEFEQVLGKMLGKAPHLRFRSCDRFIAALEEV